MQSTLSAFAIEAGRRDRVIMVRAAGALPGSLPDVPAERLEGLIAHRPVIIDLRRASVMSATPVVGLARWVLGANQPEQSCVVCTRAARALLRRSPAAQCLPMFGTVADALQARAFARDGYGTGWHPAAPRQH